MPRPIALAVFLASGAYLVHSYRPPPPPPAPAPPRAAPAPVPVIDDAEIASVRRSLQDSDPRVRWSAAQFLSNIQDPRLGELLERMVSGDPDPDVRAKIMRLTKDRGGSAALGGLVRALGDPDKSVRLASLAALGDIGDPSVATWVAALLKDPEPEVRAAALRTLGRFQDKRAEEFRALAATLQRNYQEALSRSAKGD